MYWLSLIHIYDLSQQINTEIFSHYQHEIDINQIQKIVEDHLMTSKYPQIARAYIEYRHDRDLAREKRSQLTKEDVYKRQAVEATANAPTTIANNDFFIG